MSEPDSEVWGVTVCAADSPSHSGNLARDSESPAPAHVRLLLLRFPGVIHRAPSRELDLNPMHKSQPLLRLHHF
jgi:hypothetical protein